MASKKSNSYNGDTELDMQGDYDDTKNTGKLSDLFDESDLNQNNDNLNDWN
ncbi:MAG: hypothetical protein K2J23_02970 [Muribaculaceae bacterium]|nr:hypothetical protein [Muribaculaceae bacterium]